MTSTIIATIGLILIGICKILWFTYFKKYYYKKYNIPLYTTSFEYGYKKCKIPLLKVRFGPTFVYLILDTGANLNFITKDYYDTNPTKFTSQANTALKIYSSTSMFTEEQFHVKTTLRHKHFQFKDIEFVVTTDLDNALAAVSQTLGAPVVGILGTPFMKTAKLTIDFNNDVLLIKVK